MTFNGFPTRQNVGNLFASYPLTSPRIPFCNNAGWLKDDINLNYTSNILQAGGFNIGGGSTDLSAMEFPGSFSPSCMGTMTQGSYTYTTQTGYYYRMGNLLYLYLNLAPSGGTQPTGQLVITGMPFATTNTYLTGSIESVYYYGTRSLKWLGWMIPGSTRMLMYFAPVTNFMAGAYQPLMYDEYSTFKAQFIGGGVMLLSTGL